MAILEKGEKLKRANACPRCKKPGSHYVPPGFGSTGFFICDPEDKPKASRTPENYALPCGNCGRIIAPGEDWSEHEISGYTHVNCRDKCDKFQPFGRPTGKWTITTADEELLKVPSRPLVVIVPVEIEQ